MADCQRNVITSIGGFSQGGEDTLSATTTNTDTFFFVMWAAHTQGAEGNLVSITADQTLCITVEQNGGNLQ